MNRKNFLGHLALALTIVLLAAFAGQVRRWQKEWQAAREEARLVAEKQESAEESAEPAGDQEESDAAEVLVRFKPGVSEEQIEEITAQHNDDVEDEIESVKGLALIEDEDGETAEEVAAEYRSMTDIVEYAEPNSEIALDREAISDHVLPDDPMFADQWALENKGQKGGKENADIAALRAWHKTTGSDKIVVAVIDTGVDYTHRDLIQNIWVRPPDMAAYEDEDLGTIDDQHGFNAVDDNGDPMDDNGHGTHCAGIVGAEGGNGFGISGVNWKVEIMPVKFMDASGSGTTAQAIESINYVIERKRAGVNVRVISASWGSTAKSKALEDVIRKAGEEGIIFIAASGNSSADADKTPHYPAGYELPNVLSIAALNRNDQLASFSNYGAKRVHIAAPGAEILSTWLNGDFREASGTSMATPVVAGVAALALSAEPNMSVEQLRERLLKSVDKLDALNGKVSTGGRINAAKAVGEE